jgi:hypothetical protein
MFEVVDQKYTSDRMSGKSKSTDGLDRGVKGSINFEELEFRPQFFVPIKSCCGEASLIGDLPKWEDEASLIIVFCLNMSLLTCLSLVGILAHNATRFSLSNEPFLLKKSCVFLCS